tara:strand:+ start:6092 stop:9085 length:2994 start_codon:yes stop_codon:yes gene_type:complete
MSVSVVKSGPYFTGSGPIKWSDLRTYFKETSTGTISASELFVDTRLAVRDPIVPDSTENTSIPTDGYPGGVFSETSNNWKASLMRDSIKRYTANQTGQDENLDLGFKKASGGGIDWDGQNNLDVEGSITGNYGRNVQKVININGTVYSDDDGENGLTGDGGIGKNKKAACSLVLEPGVAIGSGTLKALNVRFYLKSGSGIYGSAGKKGYFPDSHPDKTLSDPGKDGGVALTIRHEGEENRSWVYNEGGELFGGGGGGEQGEQGAWPVQKGICDRGYTTSCTSGYYFGGYDEGCHGSSSGGCNAGDQTYMLHIATLPCPGGGGSGSIYAYYCRFTSCSTTYLGSYDSTLPQQGRGGAGGRGAGWDNGAKQGSTSGEGGKANIPATCSGGETPSGASNSTPGGAGGDGGDFGQPGGSTNGISPSATELDQGEGGGKGGAAMCGRYFNPVIQGYNTSQYVKGSVGLECDGTEGTPVIPPDIPTVTINSHSAHVRFNYPVNDGTNKQTLNCTNSSTGQKVRFKILNIWDDYSDISDIALRKFELKNTDGSVIWESTRDRRKGTRISPVLELDEGKYDVVWHELHQYNRPDSGANWVKNRHILSFGQRIELFDDGSDPDEGGLGFRAKINNQFIICPEDQIADDSVTWEKSYNSAKHDGYDNNGNREYVAIHDYWSQFMRDYAVWEQNDDPKTQNGDAQATQEYLLVSGVQGEHTIEMQSDNDCELYINEDLIAHTTKYDSHYDMNEGISRCGRWESKNPDSGKPAGTLVTDGTPIKYDYSGERRSLRVIAHNRKFVDTTYDVIYGPAYVANESYVKQFKNDAGTSQEFTIVFQGVEKGRIEIGGGQSFPIETVENGLKRRYYAGERVVNNGNPWNQPDYWEIKVEEESNPEDWQHNPCGVAFRVKDPNGNVVLESTDFNQAEGTVYGPGEIQWSVSGVDLNLPTDSIYQNQSPVNDQSFKITPGQTSGTSRFNPTYGTQTYKIYAKNSGGTSNPPGEVVVQ